MIVHPGPFAISFKQLLPCNIVTTIESQSGHVLVLLSGFEAAYDKE